MRLSISLLISLFFYFNLGAQTQPWQGKFEPIDHLISPSNSYRTASGAPGKDYWQQRANYKIKAELDEGNNVLSGEETITYFNNSPDNLSYLWVQLEQNVNKKGNEDFGSINNNVKEGINTRKMQFLTRAISFPAGYTIKYVKDGLGNNIKTLVNNTMMKVKLNQPLKSGESTTLKYSLVLPYHRPQHVFALQRRLRIFPGR